MRHCCQVKILWWSLCYVTSGLRQWPAMSSTTCIQTFLLSIVPQYAYTQCSSTSTTNQKQSQLHGGAHNAQTNAAKPCHETQMATEWTGPHIP